jgi:hypothetical protein
MSATGSNYLVEKSFSKRKKQRNQQINCEPNIGGANRAVSHNHEISVTSADSHAMQEHHNNQTTSDDDF